MNIVFAFFIISIRKVVVAAVAVMVSLLLFTYFIIYIFMFYPPVDRSKDVKRIYSSTLSTSCEV